MAKDTKPHDWNREQPHDSKTGRFTKESYARNKPGQVEWVKNKK